MLKKWNIRNSCVQNIVYRKKDNNTKEKSVKAKAMKIMQGGTLKDIEDEN